MYVKLESWIDAHKKNNIFVLKESEYQEDEFFHLIQTLALNCTLSATPMKDFVWRDKVIPYKAFESLIWGQKVLKPTGDDSEKVSFSFMQKLGLPYAVRRAKVMESQWWRTFGSDRDLPVEFCSPIFSCVKVDNKYVADLFDAFTEFDMRTSKDFSQKSRHWASMFITAQLRPDSTYMEYLAGDMAVTPFLNMGDTIVKSEVAIKPVDSASARRLVDDVKRITFYDRPSFSYEYFQESLTVYLLSGRFNHIEEKVDITAGTFFDKLHFATSDEDVNKIVSNIMGSYKEVDAAYKAFLASGLKNVSYIGKFRKGLAFVESFLLVTDQEKAFKLVLMDIFAPNKPVKV